MRIEERVLHESIQEAGGMPEIDEAIRLIQEFRSQEYFSKKGNPLKKKNRRLAKWDPRHEDIYELVIAIWCMTMVHGPMTMQAVCGLLNNRIDMVNTIDRVHILASCVALVSKTGLIQVHRGESGQNIMVDSEYQMGDELPVIDRHGTVFNRVQPVYSNLDPDQGSMLLGGKINHHEKNICLDHINKMNRIPLTLNKGFLFKYAEDPKKDYFTDEWGNEDPAWKHQVKEDMWKLFKGKSQEKYLELMSSKGGNRCYLNHKYCTRGRTYAVGYYINTQGSSFKKACLELAHKEMLND